MREHRRFSDLFRRLIAGLLAALLLCGPVPVAQAASDLPFEDVKPGKWYYEAVRWAYENGITSGTSETTFSPHQELSCSQISQFLYRYAYSPIPHYEYADAFADYESRYFYASINWVCDFGIVPLEEVSDGNRPGDKLTRNRFVNLLYRYAVNWEHRSVATEADHLGVYEDVPTDETEREAWNWAVEIGMISGTSSTTLSPEKILTRAEFVTMLYRYETQDEMLRGEILIGKRLRGWQRTLLETGELAYGVPWVNFAYELGPDGIPTEIDCSGIQEWTYTYSGIYKAPNLDCAQLWASDHFTRIFTRAGTAKAYSETGWAFINRIRRELRPGDLIFCGLGDTRHHMMMYLSSDASYVYVFHSRSGVGVCVEAIPNTDLSYYLKNAYGVKRHIP